MKHYILSIIAKNYQRFRISVFNKLSDNKNVTGLPIKNSPVLLIGKGEVFFGNEVKIGYYPSPYFYDRVAHIEAREKEAKILFGNRININNGLVIICEKSSITIHDDVLIGTNVEIIDSDFHEIHPKRRNSGNHHTKPVIINKNVFLGSNVKICKGVTIGENSIIGNGSIVFEDVPDNVIAIGNPAKVVKKIL